MTQQDTRMILAAALEQTGRGDHDAFATVYRMTSAKLFGICLRMLPTRQEAEETLQDVYVSVWRKAAQFDAGRASAISWLAAIAHNRAIDRLRAARAHRPREVAEDAAYDIADDRPDADQILLFGEELTRLDHCLEELEERARWAIRSAFLTGRTHDELSRSAAMPVGTLKSIIRRGLMKLRGCMEP
ncbi:sigma-70 family RNA polymerase sigma factor [Aureimonas altamirensis]|uniref:sigma-70 family RNA polymerase sigma factor n=1 Tax=Aureimonas altamirensis TaxID=370622 RepID=UPI002556C392|nr:sigma-70 family RNA polymerase sigma factor [Aureimonas altamirensis]